MECLGGVGFIEDSVMPRLFRTSPLNAIWEGSGNVIALDVKPALSEETTLAVFSTELRRIADKIPSVKPLTDWLMDNPNADARLFAERAAIVFAASAFPKDPVRSAWIGLRLRTPSHTWGANASTIDAAHLVGRLNGWEHGV